MKMTKTGWMLTTVPSFYWSFCKGVEKKQKSLNIDGIHERLEKLHGLKVKGAITEEEYGQIKERWMSEL